jgi:uncharacterized membrane protein YbhN (UPF0104 family)
MIERLPLRPILFSLVALGVATGVALAVAASAGFDAVGDVFARVKPIWLIVVAGGQLVGLLGYVLTYRIFGGLSDGRKLPPPLAARLVAAGFGAFTVGGGFALDHRALEASGEDSRSARIRVLRLGVLEYVVLAPAACLSAIVLVINGTKANDTLLWPWIILVPAGFALAFWATARRERLVRGRNGTRRRLDEALCVLSDVRRFHGDATHAAEAVLGMILYWCGEIVSLWAALETFGAHISVPTIILAYATGYAATRRTLPLGGAGATEALMTFALHWVGLSIPTAFAAVVVYRFFNFAVVTPPALQARASLEQALRRGSPAALGAPSSQG